MGLGPGSRMKQEIYRDTFNLEDWDQRHRTRCFVHIKTPSNGVRSPASAAHRTSHAAHYQSHGVPGSTTMPRTCRRSQVQES
jgi:hypothetical protein